jgi:polysaccharide pyruvyl transferase WcaK-like protein
MDLVRRTWALCLRTLRRGEPLGYDYSSCMRILVLHAWLKGNLGDVLQLSVLLSALRELRPERLDLAGFPARPAAESAELLGLADRYLPDTFPWYWSLAPASVGRLVFEPWWRKRRRALFSGYDAVVCAPGPYLADYDPRVISALSDITVASELGRAVILSSHSIGPLRPHRLRLLGGATARVARESRTYRYLSEHGVSSVLSADYAFLYPYAGLTAQARGPVGPPYCLVFLRSNNLDANALRIERGALYEGTRLIADASGDRLILATSDHRRDARFLDAAARRLGVPSVACRSVADLVQLVSGASLVVSDRYHPAICAASLGRPAQVLSNREPHKMEGLKGLLADNTLEELQELARAGLRTVRDALRSTR